MENVTLPDDAGNSFKKFRRNYEASNRMYNELKEHVGKYVVIDNGNVIGFTDTYQEATEKFGKIDGVFIELVTDKNIFWIL